MGDSVTDFVNWAIVWLGKHAPDVAKLFGGISSGSGKVQAVKAAIEKVEDDEKRTTNGFDGIADIENGKFVPADRSDHNAFASVSAELAQHAYQPHIMLQVAQKVTSHLDQSPPRKYTYEEWTFLLKLLGEDESDGDGHRRIGQPLPEGVEVASPIRQHEQRQAWSWMGQESPLMSLEDDSEPKWVQQRLMEVLAKELKERGDRRVERGVNAQTVPDR